LHGTANANHTTCSDSRLGSPFTYLLSMWDYCCLEVRRPGLGILWGQYMGGLRGIASAPPQAS